MRIWTLCLLLIIALAPAAFAADKDTLVVAVSSDIHTLDPGVSSDNYDWRQIYPCYDRLVKYKVKDGVGLTEVEPMAAESWTVSDDGLKWTFKIRKGISFDDGSPLNAEAVRYSFDRTLAIGKGPADNLTAIASMAVVDDYTLEITLKNPYGPFLQTLATNGASIINPKVAAKAVGDDKAQAFLAENIDGSGPFKIVEWTRGQRCRGCLAQALVAQGDVAVQEVFQLTHIARQGQTLHMLQQGRAGRRHGQAVFLRHIGQQALAQQGQVFAALAQGGQLHVNHVQAVEQVLAKAPRLHIVGQVAVGGADDAHVHAFFLGGPQGTHAALLDGAQQLGLHGQG